MNLKMTPQATEELKSLYPKHFQEVMAAGLTLIVWGFAIVVYLQQGGIPDWLLGLVTALVGVWIKPPSGS